MYPKVSLLWVNYNSSGFKNIIKDSIESIKNLDYPNFEFIAVDGGSTDDSPNFIEGLLKKSKIDNYKFIRQRENLGLHSSWNIAYSSMSNSKYFMLLNNDVKIYPNAVREFVGRLEQDEKIGALNGIEIKWGSKLIANTGAVFDELFTVNILSKNIQVENCERNEHFISAASAAISMFRTSALKKLGEPLLEENMFRHFNETILGARLWNAGYKVIFTPIEAGEHHMKLIEESKSLKRFYYSLRGWLTLLFISNSPYKNSIFKDTFLLKQLGYPLIKDFKNYKKLIRFYKDVSADAKQKAVNLLKRKIFIDIYKIPHIKGFRYYWIFPRSLTKIIQPSLRFRDLRKSLYIPKIM